MHIILFDDRREHLFPFTFTRPCADLRVGIDTLAEKWADLFGAQVSYLTEEYLSGKYPAKWQAGLQVLVNGSVIGNADLTKEILELENNTKLVSSEGVLIAVKAESKAIQDHLNGANSLEKFDARNVKTQFSFLQIRNTWDIFKYNGEVLKADFERITKDCKSATIDESNRIIGNNFFAEEGAKASCAIFNTTDAPIYLGKNSEVMEGAIVRGGLALCESAVLKMGAKIYGPTIVGPWSKVGGEVGNSVILGYSNKGHDGYLGNSVIGEWCNLGADTNTSNLKNNYANVKLWNYAEGRFADTGEQFCGLMMGDHSKCGINTMFNTGTVVGVSANIFGAGFPRNIIESFSWGGASGFTNYRLDKAMEVAKIVMARRKIDLTDNDAQILKHIYESVQADKK